ncbi:hypothetical protein NNO07_10985 [Pseudomonas resinovorans]|uniref:Mu-like prophage FluMu N-terminal domain-containing protein n=1 Tax=Metapseudomonas resinovorans TaxID=53412 RepID=A0ABT4Y413_METRE|nr:hypothetical protein [Pseudomonas resinovorans]MDA8483597.1 hypothetical protein [Pseudomonas resinovorans]
MAKAPVTKPAVTKTAHNSKAAAKASAAKTLPGIFVRSFPLTFRRAGFEFTQEGYGLLLQDLSKAQQEAIRSEPMLSVQDTEFPASAADDALMAEQLAEGGANETANPTGPADPNAAGTGGEQSGAGNA